MHNPRKDWKGGGVGLYLVDNLDFKLIVDYFGTSEHFCCEKITKKKKKERMTFHCMQRSLVMTILGDPLK